MNAKKCDACGKFYEHYGNKRGEYNTLYMQVNSKRGSEIECVAYDLCPECMEKVRETLKGGRE